MSNVSDEDTDNSDDADNSDDSDDDECDYDGIKMMRRKVAIKR